MRLITFSFQITKDNYSWYGKHQHTGASLAIHLKDVFDRFELTDSRLFQIMTDTVSSQYSITRELHSTLEASGIDRPALRTHIPRVNHVIQLASGTFISSLAVKCRTKSREAHELNQQFGETQSLDIGKSQRLQKGGNGRINNVLAMKPGLAQIIEKVRISWYFETAETDLHIAENACCTDYTNTWLLKWVHWLSKSQSPYCGSSHSGCQNLLLPDAGLARAGLPITWIYMHEA